jgi:outer membrane protein assembly factor BamB
MVQLPYVKFPVTRRKRSFLSMRMFVRSAVLLGVSLTTTLNALYAQRGGDWMTVGNDAQRSSWVRNDAKISPATMRKPGFELVWKVKLKNEARQLDSLTPPVLFDFYISYRGFRSLGFVGGSSGNVTAIDIDLARLEWEKAFPSSSSTSSIECPGGMTSSVTRPTVTGYPGPGFAGFGRGAPAASGVGEPLEGAVTLKEREARLAAPPPPPPSSGASRRIAPPSNPYAPTVQYVNAITADGKFHSMYVSNGEEPSPPIDFLPANANARGLIVFDKTAYVATINGCGGVENGVWALNLESKQVTKWKSDSGVAGSAGFAVGPDGTLYVANANGELVALEPGRLTVKGSYKAGKAFTATPVVFDYKDKDLIAVATSDGKIQLLDSAALAGPVLAASQAFSSEDFATGSLASWQDSNGTRWVLAPAGGAVAAGAGFAGNGDVKNGAIVAFKVVEQNGTPTLQPGWVSRDMVSPLTPAVINGVVFALASGEFRSSDARLTAAQRTQRSSNAVLYALDAATGKELWNSGSAITSVVHSGGLAAGAGRVYVGGHDGTQYAFSFPMEH